MGYTATLVRPPNGIYMCEEGHVYLIDPLGKKSPAEIIQARTEHYLTSHMKDPSEVDPEQHDNSEPGKELDPSDSSWASFAGPDPNQIGIHNPIGSPIGGTFKSPNVTGKI